MRLLKILSNFILFILVILICTWIILPKSYFFISFLKKKGIMLYPEVIKEGIFTTELYKVHAFYSNIEFEIPKIELTWYQLTIPCKKGEYLKVSYSPLKTFKIFFNNLKGACIGRKDFEEISGSLVYRYPDGLFGKVTISNFQSPLGPLKIYLHFSGDKLTYNIPTLNLHKTIKLKELKNLETLVSFTQLNMFPKILQQWKFP